MPVLLGLYISYQWGLSSLAAFTVAAAALAVGIVVADWGSSRFLPRELSRRDSAAAAVTATSTGVRVVLASAVTGFALAFALTGGLERDVLPFLFLLAPVVFSSVAATNAVSARVVDGDLRGLYTAVAAGAVPVAAAALVVGRSPSGAIMLVAAYAAGKWLETFFLTRGRWSVQRISFHHAGPVFLMMLPFGLSAIMGTVYSRLPILVLEGWGTRSELGVVAVSTALQNVLLLVPTASALLIYPRLTAAVTQADRSAFRASLRQYFYSSSTIVVCGLLVLWLVREPLCSLLDVPPASSTFLVLYVSMAFISTINAMGGAVLQACGEENRAAWLGAAVLILAVPLQVFAVRQWGMWGALSAVAVSETSACVFFSTSAWRASVRAIASGQATGARATTTT